MFPMIFPYCRYLFKLALLATVLTLGFARAFGLDEVLNSNIGYFDLPIQPLQSGLIEFALQADVTIVAEHSLISGERTSPVVGYQNVDRALTTLLSSSALTHYYMEESKAYVILPKAMVEVANQTEADESEKSKKLDNIDEILVSGVVYPTRYTTIMNSQLHNGISYFDSSRFLNVLPQTLIQDQQPRDIPDLLKYASSVTFGDGLADTNDDVYLRGFQRHASYVDGFRMDSATGIRLSPASVQQVEILKGPSTVRYGQAEPGGIVNLVRKKPQDEEFVEGKLEAGSFGHREVNLDANGSLFASENTWVRLIVALESQDESSELSDISRQFASLASSWQMTAETSLDMSLEHKKTGLTLDRSAPVFLAYGEESPGATLEDIALQARLDFSADANFFSAELNHSISSEWQLRANYFWHDEERLGVRNNAEAMLESDLFFHPGEWGSDYLILIPGGQIVFPILIQPVLPEWIYSLGVVRNIYDEQAWDTANSVRLNLEGDFESGRVQHHLTMGSDWHRQDIFKRYVLEERDHYSGQNWTETEFSEMLASIADTLFDPQRAIGSLSIEDRQLVYNDIGVYLQDNIELNEKWIISIGTRYSAIDGEYYHVNNDELTELQSYQRFSSQLGLVFKPTENHSIYANYSEALRANYHVDDLGSQKAEPELSSQIELGLKSQLFAGRLNSSVAIYQIDKKNIVQLAIVDGLRRSLQAYEQKARGLDADISYEASSRLNLIGAASLMSPEFVSGPYVGKVPAMATEATASLFLNYQWNDELNFNGGVKYVGERYADNLNQFYLGDYASVDFGLSYQFVRMEGQPVLRVSIKNLLDTDYYTAILSGVRENYAQGRSVDVSVSATF